jgi:hypothetical protein
LAKTKKWLNPTTQLKSQTDQDRDPGLIYPAGRLWMMEKGKVSYFGRLGEQTKTPSEPKMAGKVG